MRGSHFTRLAASVAVAAAVQAEISARAGADVDHLSDGTELVVARIPGARAVSFRYAVCAGAANDPPQRAGLAHLLEHVIFRGNHEVDVWGLFNAVDARGGRINAFTGPERTTYVLDDIRAAEVAPVLTQYIGALTNPALVDDDIAIERSVVAAEAILSSSDGIFWVLSGLLLSGAYVQSSVIGTDLSRARIARSDLVSFYERYYRPSNITIVLTGDVDPAQAKTLLEGASSMAPAASEEDPGRDVVDFETPVDATTVAPFHFALLGYDLTTADRTTCRELADLLQLRATVAINVEKQIPSTVRASCTSLRGHQLLVAIVSSANDPGSEVPERLEAVFESLKAQRITGAERAHLIRKSEHRRSITLADPAMLADSLAEELLAEGCGVAGRGQSLNRVFEPMRFDAANMQRVAVRGLVEQRRISLKAAPF